MSRLVAPPVTRAYASPESRSARLFREAQRVMPGGNSRTSVFMAPYPPYAAEGRGCWVVDVDGDRRVDFLNNYTSLIHGHANPAVTEAATERLARGSCFPLPTPEEVELAALLVDRLPSVDQVRFTNSGSEAVMTAIKAARAFTGRHRIAKCEGAYHGSYDYVEVSLGPRPDEWGPLEAPRSVAYARSMPPAVADDVVVIPFNHPEAAVACIERAAASLAAVVIDPMPNRVGLLPATPEFLRAIRDVTRAHDILLIFDEVISFRLGYHGAQGAFGIEPDLTTLGKIIGGGLPVGAVGGQAAVMAVFDPRGGQPAVPHAGTFNANPVTMAAGLAAMRQMDREAFHRLDEMGAALRGAVADTYRARKVAGGVSGRGSLFRLHGTDRPLVDYRSVVSAPQAADRVARVVRHLIDHGVLVSITGLGCLSTPMTGTEIETFVGALDGALGTL
jgi:glutamate-1-semialdehyde 2,1-aminomutase